MKKKLNIAFLITKISERGGISRVVSILSDELQKKNIYNIHIISFQQRDLQGYRWNNALIFHNLVEDKVHMKKGIFKATIKNRKIIDENKIDVVIACGALVGPLGVLSTIIKKTKLIYWSHSSFKATTSNKFRIINEHLTALFSNTLISLTKVDEKNYRKETLARKIVQIYNPIDKNLENISSPYNSRSKKIISVGRLTTQKNFGLLVDVAKIVLEKHKDFSWHIFGSGEDKEKIETKIKNLNLEGRLILKGQCNNLYDIYNEYSMMVMTSIYEGFPMTLLEGMAFKLPLVSFDVPTGPNEIIYDGINGFLIKPFDIKDMAVKINILIEDENKKQLFSACNSNYIEQFNMKSITTKWISLLEEL